MSAEQARFLGVTEALTQAGGTLLALHERAAFVGFGPRGLVVVVWPSLRGSALEERLQELLVLEPRAQLTILAIGGGPDVRAALERMRDPRRWRRRLTVVHLDADGDAPATWHGGRPLSDTVTTAIAAEVPPENEIVDVRARLQQLAPTAPEGPELEALEARREFTLRLRRGRVPLTWTFLGAIAIGFGLELWFGGSEWLPVLVRLGANLGGDGLEDSQAWWRLGSATFLHAGWLHFAINSYVLFVLGSFFERIIGRARYGIIFVAAAFGGGFASAMGSAALVSVGASGAIWGLLGASAALAIRPGRLVPKHLAKPMRRMALINLIINLSISFLPRIDLLAHLGGGLVGLLVMLVLGEVDRRVLQSDSASRRTRVTRVVQGGLALALVGLLFGAWGLALATGKVWELAQPQPVARPIAGELVVPVPAALSACERVAHEESSRLDVYRCGDLVTDPFAVVVATAQLERAPFDGLRRQFLAADIPRPEGATALGPKRVLEGQRPALEQAFLFPNGLRSIIRTQLLPARREQPPRRIEIEVTLWSGAPSVWSSAAMAVLEAVVPF